MSHFTVLVIGDDVEKQLAPFQENNMCDCPKEYLEFNDLEEEMLTKYMTGDTEMIELSDGNLYSKYDDMFKTMENFVTKYKYPEGYNTVKMPFTREYPTFDDYVRDYEGYAERDAETGKYGYWENPNAKWDWYQLGGRWNGFFRLRIGREGVSGPGSWANEYRSPSDDHADQALKGDIDFEGMRFDAKKSAEEEWDTIVSWYGDPPKIEQTWFDFMNMEFLDIEQKRDAYWNQPSLLYWKDMQNKLRQDDVAKEKYSKRQLDTLLWAELSKYQCTKKEHIDAAGASAIATFAFVKDGQWVERGNMGWWGMVSNEEDMAEWQRKFSEMLDGLPDDTLLSVIDCHI